jgi:hypothetical protein
MWEDRVSKEYDDNDDPLEEGGFGQGAINNDYAFAQNNPNKFFSKSTPYQRPMGDATTIDDDFSPSDDKGEEDRQFVVFLTTEENGDPIDYQREYFGNREDAQEFINTMKENPDQTDARKQYDGYIVPIDMEKEAEEQLNELINTGDSGDRELPQAVDAQGAYWAEQRKPKPRIIHLRTTENYHNVRLTVNGVRCRLIED